MAQHRQPAPHHQAPAAAKAAPAAPAEPVPSAPPPTVASPQAETVAIPPPHDVPLHHLSPFVALPLFLIMALVAGNSSLFLLKHPSAFFVRLFRGRVPGTIMDAGMTRHERYDKFMAQVYGKVRPLVVLFDIVLVFAGLAAFDFPGYGLVFTGVAVSMLVGFVGGAIFARIKAYLNDWLDLERLNPPRVDYNDQSFLALHENIDGTIVVDKLPRSVRVEHNRQFIKERHPILMKLTLLVGFVLASVTLIAVGLAAIGLHPGILAALLAVTLYLMSRKLLPDFAWYAVERYVYHRGFQYIPVARPFDPVPVQKTVLDVQNQQGRLADREVIVPGLPTTT